MKVIIAIDSFKESLGSLEAGRAAERGVQSVFPDAQTHVLPVADGGEGTVDALVSLLSGRVIKARVTGPLGDEVEARLGICADRSTAVIEVADAAGLSLVPPKRRDPAANTTRGVGQLVRRALDLGATRILIGLGGSATNDGGIGMAFELGFIFEDDCGREIARPVGRDLQRIARIVSDERDERLDRVSIEAVTDVDNPLCGPYGAARTYGPQKGADGAQCAMLDAGLENLATRMRIDLGHEVRDIAGAGAAGGLGAAVVGFCGGTIRAGIDFVLDTAGFDDLLEGADYVITGEGRIDAQTARGKVPAGVAKRAGAAKVPVIAVAGAVSADADVHGAVGLGAIFSVMQGPMSLEEALLPDRAAQGICRTTQEIFRLIRLERTGVHAPRRR